MARQMQVTRLTPAMLGSGQQSHYVILFKITPSKAEYNDAGLRYPAGLYKFKISARSFDEAKFLFCVIYGLKDRGECLYISDIIEPYANKFDEVYNSFQRYEL